ncbi:MAG TPA: response regulator transcription factor [Capsulimonadaceae bacterium]|jgi:two-component system copper resistance phosphate regulon response regulator CusR
MTNLLVIEDEAEIAEAIKFSLTREGFNIDIASNGAHGLELALHNDYATILLDLMLPGKDGFEVCHALRTHKVSVPILMLTARRGVLDRIRGLELGADDYLPKPFATPELVARVNALIRRDSPNRNTVIEVMDLRIDTRMCRATRNGRELSLTPREYRLLEALALRKGEVLSRETIAEEIWNDRDSTSNTVDVHVAQLRRKLLRTGSPQPIQTVHGRGYTLFAQPAGDAL